MAQIADLQVQYLATIDTTAGNVIQAVTIPDAYPVHIGRGQNSRTLSISGELSADTDALALTLKNQLLQLCSNDAEMVFISFDRTGLPLIYDGFYLTGSCRVSVGETFRDYAFSLSAKRLDEGSLGTYFAAFGIENDFAVTKLSITALPSGITYATGPNLIALPAGPDTVYVRENTANQGVYKLEAPQLPDPNFYIGQCVIIDDFGGSNPQRVYGRLERFTGTTIGINNGIIMFHYDIPTGIISLYILTIGGAWVTLIEEVRFLVNGETGTLTTPKVESISINQVKWSMNIFDSTGLFATVQFTLNKGSYLIKIQITTNDGVTIDDVEMYADSPKTITDIFNEVASIPDPLPGLIDNDGFTPANYGGGKLNNNALIGYAYTRRDDISNAGKNYPSPSTSAFLSWGRTVEPNDSQIFGMWLMPATVPYPPLKVGRGLLADTNFNYVL
jgi:hypothetical protein